MGGNSKADDRARAHKARIHAEVKRDNAVTNIERLFELSSQTITSPDLIPKFLLSARNVDKLWSQFSTSNDSLLDALIDLDLVGDFKADLDPQVRDMVTSIQLAVDKCNNSPISSAKPVLDHGIEVVASHDHTVEGNVRSDIMPSPMGSHGTLPLTSDARGARLPKIPLPSFDGSIQNWPVFRDRYTVLVGDNVALSDIEKYYYLLSCLQPVAAEVIKGITVSGDTYSVAWSTLVQRFDKPRQLASAIVEKLLTANVADKETLSSLTSFLNTFDEASASLRALNIPDLSGYILFVTASRCLPLYCRKLFEAENRVEYPTIGQLLNFVKSRVQILENSEISHNSSSKGAQGVKPNNQRGSGSNKSNRVALVGTNPPPGKVSTKCRHCGSNHSIEQCFKFKRMPVHDRREALRKNRLCYACLSDQHMVSQCAVTKPCSKCDDKHHSLVHRNNASESNATIDNVAPIDPTVTVSSMTSSVIHRNVMLGTALVHIRNHSGFVHTVRALIDGGSQISVLTTRCVDRLGLKLKRWTAAVTGLAGVEVPSVVGQVKCVMTPRYAETPQIPISAWVLNNITSSMPTRPMPSDVKERYSNLAMADPSFDQPGPIDLLIGADLYPLVMESGKVVVGEDLPAAFSTIFGWIIVGSVPKSPMGEPHCGLVSLSVSLEETLNKFWQVEEPDAAPREFTEHGQYEQIFCNQMFRLDDGRFSVPLPFRVPVGPDTLKVRVNLH